MNDIYIALGSNLGDRVGNLTMARDRLEAGGWLRIEQCSPLYETEPWGPVEQGWYVNQVCQASTELPPAALLRWLHAVERLGGRDRQTETRWGPRTLDVDLLAYGSMVYQDNLVQVPHPRLHERRFVLQPLADIAPGWRHPLLDLTAAALLERVEDSGALRLLRL